MRTLQNASGFVSSIATRSKSQLTAIGCRSRRTRLRIADVDALLDVVAPATISVVQRASAVEEKKELEIALQRTHTHSSTGARNALTGNHH
jgi:hypothetical protein